MQNETHPLLETFSVLAPVLTTILENIRKVCNALGLASAISPLYFARRQPGPDQLRAAGTHWGGVESNKA